MTVISTTWLDAHPFLDPFLLDSYLGFSLLRSLSLLVPVPKLKRTGQSRSVSMTDSALDLIRCLKGSADPPTPGGPSKIELAQQGWVKTSLYMPNKAETILEWLLTRLLKDKDRDP